MDKECNRESLGFNTQPPEGGWLALPDRVCTRRCFNTQPPEGGWFLPYTAAAPLSCFNTQPPEGGWLFLPNLH